MDKISLRQIISALSKGGSIPEWLTMEEIRSSIIAMKKGDKFTGGTFVCYPIEEDGSLVNILFVKSNPDATALLRLLQGEGDE